MHSHHVVGSRTGAAATLIGTYKTGFLRQSQFVAPDPLGGGGSLGAEGEGDVREEMLKRKEDGCEVPQGFEEGARPPRFFTQRECCRLMGFPEWYVSCVCAPGLICHACFSELDPYQ
jgi:hypothetical protein